MAEREGLPWIVLPERLDRRLRLGPFPSGTDAVKFVAAAAVGATLSLTVALWTGLPIVVVGAILVLWRPEGEPLDERMVAIARWALRRSVQARPMTGPARAEKTAARSTLPLPDGRMAAVLSTGGAPLMFLPPEELAHQFELYRRLLRSVEGGLILLATTTPIYAGAVAPLGSPAGETEHAACEGYRELVSLLARRRSVRRVLLALVQDAGTPDLARRLEASTTLLRERLADLGLRAERLRDRPLLDAARRLGIVERTAEG